MYVTRKELVDEIRAVQSDIRTAAKDLGGEVRSLYAEIKSRDELIQDLSMRLRLLEEKINLSGLTNGT